MAKLSMNKNPKQRENTGGPSRLDLMKRVKELEASAGEERPPDAIRTASPFRDLFPVKPEVLDGVREDMKANGYDTTQPLIVWADRDVLIDGHTRLQAARDAGLDAVPVMTVSLESEDDAVAYAYGLQFRRRNLDDADRFAFLEGIAESSGEFSATLHKTPVPPEGGRPREAINKETVAELLTVSARTAQKYVNVLKNAPEDVKARVRSGELTINQADRALRPQNPENPESPGDSADSEGVAPSVKQRENSPPESFSTTTRAGDDDDPGDLEPDLGPEDDAVTLDDARGLVRDLDALLRDLGDFPVADDVPPSVRSDYQHRLTALQHLARSLGGHNA